MSLVKASFQNSTHDLEILPLYVQNNINTSQLE